MNLRNNSIVDVSPLAGLTSLTDLRLRNNSIVDVSPLAGLTSLTYLLLSSNSITTGVGTLTGLAINGASKLNLTNNGVSIPCADLTAAIAAYTAGYVIPFPAASGGNCT